MLIKCKECELQVSSLAIVCPHCGYPLKDSPKYNSTKRRRLPNGFGQITKINNKNLRNQYRAMVTVGKNSNGRPICKLLKPQAYFRTYNEAYAALVEYNKNPYDLESDLTTIQLYEKWSEWYFSKLKSDASKRTITSAWKYCSSVYNIRVKDLRARHIKDCMDNGTVEYNGTIRTASTCTKTRIKSLFNLMLDYALEYELVDKNYARTFDVSKELLDDQEKMKRSHISFTDEEIKVLWNNVYYIEWIDIILFQCYTGFRPKELGLIELNNVDLDRNIIVGGIKTKAGTNRVVPIHPAIRHIVEYRYNEAINLNSKYLFNCNGKMTYDKYANRFENIIKRLDLNESHRPHDPRKHFVTMAKKYNVDEYAIKYIVGHAIDDLTERVYTDRTISWLTSEIQKIKLSENIAITQATPHIAASPT